MTETAMEQDNPNSSKPLIFHPEFQTKAAGDVILLTDDGTSFYMRLAQLAELSSFFSTLPPPCDADIIDGTPLIPLHDATSLGLFLLLKAIRSTTSAEPFRLPRAVSSEPEKSILAAAAIARKYDLPIVYRLLCGAMEGVSGYWFRGLDKEYVRFAVWAIGGVESQLQQAATDTINITPISCISAVIHEMCRTYAPHHWTQLLDFHHRHYQVDPRFQRDLLKVADWHKDFPRHEGCTEKGKGSGALRRTQAVLRGVKDLDAILAAAENCYDLECDACQDVALDRYRDVVGRIEGFATAFVYKYDRS